MNHPSARVMRAGLPSLATPDDIVARLGRNLNQVEMARVDALLKDGSAIIRRYCRNDFTYFAGDVITLVSDGGIIKLPGRPVESVDSIVMLSGTEMVSDLNVPWFSFDGVDVVTVPPPWRWGIINLPWMWYRNLWYAQSFRTTYTHGFPDVPDEVVAVLCTAIVSELATPTMSATLASESVGAYSYSMRRTSGAGLNAALIDAGMKTNLADFRDSHGTIKIRM